MMSRVRLITPFLYREIESLVFTIRIRKIDDSTVQFLTDRIYPASKALNEMYCSINSPNFKLLLELAYELEEILVMNHWFDIFRLYKMRNRILKESRNILV